MEDLQPFIGSENDNDKPHRFIMGVKAVSNLGRIDVEGEYIKLSLKRCVKT